MSTISIVNYGCGNIGAIPNMLKRLGIASKIISTIDEIKSSDKIILPGVGAFGNAIDNLNSRHLINPLNEFALIDKKPILGICLGMQLLADESEESPGYSGFGWISGKIKKFNFDALPNGDADKFKIPHMGWNHINITQANNLIIQGLEKPKFYHVHSYHYELKNPIHMVASTHYAYDFPSIINKENIFGAQFHPEKSHRYGLKLLQNFSEI